MRGLRRPSGARLPGRAAPDGPPLLHQLGRPPVRRGVAGAAATALVVAAVLAVVVAAIVAAVRRPSASLDAAAAAELERLGAAGTLVYTDPSCEVQALSLPDLKPARRPEGSTAGCHISVSPDGRRVGPATVRWSASGKSCRAVCAWRGEELTFVRDGAVRSDVELFVPRSELERAARNHPNAPELPIDELRVLDLAWTSHFDVVALLEARYRLGLPGAQPTIAGFRFRRLRWQRPYLGRPERLVVSARDDVLFEPALRTQSPFFPSTLQPRGPIDFSPDGLMLAVATRASVFVVVTETQRLVRIPVTARDVAWR